MATLRRDQVRLVHDFKSNPPWQWQAIEPWEDPYTREMTVYLVGFGSEGSARAYGRRIGWCG
jgi:hypothetical protein